MRSLYFITEDKLKSSERTDFGLPELKKYPMPDKAHVLAAIRMFNHVDRAHEKELANSIKSKMQKYGISSDQVGDKNRLKPYLEDTSFIQNKSVNESFFGIHSSNQKYYIGRTENLQKIQTIIRSMIHNFGEIKRPFPKFLGHKITARDKFIAKPKEHWEKKLKEISELLKKEFGFKEVCIDILPLAMTNALTFMKSFIVRDLTTGMPSRLYNDGKYYDKNHQYCLNVVLFSELFTGKFTDEEIMFLLLHEIGHNFDTCIASYMADLLWWLVDLPKALDAFDKLSIFDKFNTILAIINQSVNNYVFNIYNHLIHYINKKFPKVMQFINDALHNMEVYNKIGGPFWYLSMILFQAEDLMRLTPKDIFITSLGFQRERFADSFTVCYGYGAAGVSASKKFDDLYHTTNMGNKFDNYTWVGSAIFTTFAMIIDPHPENQTRAKMILEDIKKLAEDPSMPSNMKVVLKKNYEKAKANYDDFIKVNDDEKKASALKFSRSFKETYLGGKIDLRSYIYTGSAIYGP